MTTPEFTPEAEDHDDLYGLTPDLITAIEAALDSRDLDQVEALVVPLHAADMADLLEMVSGDERRLIVDVLRPQVDPDILVELDESTRDEILDILSTDELAAAIAELDSDDAMYLVEDLDQDEQRELLAAVPVEDRAQLEAGLGYPENSAGRLMQRKLVAVHTYWTVGRLIDHLRSADDLPDEFYDIFVVDVRREPIGFVPLSRAMRAKRPVLVKDIMETDLKVVQAWMDQEDVAYAFQQYDLVSAPVVDDHGALIGVITVDDVVEVIEEEAEEDILHLGGVIETDIHEPAWTTGRRRFTWLLVNLVTALTASAVIGLFDATIEQMVALAVLMPIVASMGGNAGTQTLTVTVRALATKDVSASNAARLIGKEGVVGLANGVVFAVITGTVALVWFGDIRLGGVIGGAMVVNMLVAGLAGILIPLGLDRLGVDPAIAATVLLTTVTDVVGFFIFLGLAALVLF
ncbi:MAG: magnesium transporter [Pseudomonadota bacterium]|nr:magnesium transporter [Pseudomonadota bacterium]